MKRLTASEVDALLHREHPPPIINVLPREEHEKTHIPGTHNIPVDASDFVTQVEQRTRDKRQTVVVYDAGRQCRASPVAARKLESAGFNNVMDFESGIEGWRDSGRPLEGAA